MPIDRCEGVVKAETVVAPVQHTATAQAMLAAEILIGFFSNFR